MALAKLPAHYVIGIDGCRAGWIAIALGEDNRWEARIFSSLEALWDHWGSSQRLLIDIPIGLPSTDLWRTCDREARHWLGPRRSSIFPPPVRSAAYASEYREACARNAENTGKKISIQSWNITPKIREADRFLRAHPEAVSSILEAHPEVNFLALTGKPMIFNKKKPEGRRERIQALLPYCPAAESIRSELLERYRRSELAGDDILDALCLAVNARLSLTHGLRRLPDEPPMDEEGLPMQIVCARTSSF